MVTEVISQWVIGGKAFQTSRQVYKENGTKDVHFGFLKVNRKVRDGLDLYGMTMSKPAMVEWDGHKTNATVTVSSRDVIISRRGGYWVVPTSSEVDKHKPVVVTMGNPRFVARRNVIT